MGPPGPHFGPPGARFGSPGALLGLSRRSRDALRSLSGASRGLQNGSRRPSRRPPAQKLDFRSILDAILAPFLDPPDLENQGFRVEGLQKTRKSRGSKKAPKKHQKINLAIMEREARETRERASNASKARAERAARTARAGATRQGTEARREWREPPEDRNSKPVRSPTPLLGRFAAYAGGLRWESVSVTSFLWRPCVKPMKI